MNDVSKLSGASPVSPTSNRVWKPPQKQKSGDRPPKKDPRRKQGEEKEGGDRMEDRENREGQGDRRTLQIEEIGPQDGKGEPLSYGAGGLKKPQNHKVDLII